MEVGNARKRERGSRVVVCRLMVVGGGRGCCRGKAVLVLTRSTKFLNDVEHVMGCEASERSCEFTSRNSKP